jgi:type III pantothenate kinase
MVLTIDAGNTKTKWALFDDDGEISDQGACLNAHLSTANLLPDSLTCDQIVISNVAGEAHAKQLQQLTSIYEVTTHWLTASKQLGYVINNYTTPKSLGSDRWAALIAAWHMQHTTCVVVNVGTATTIDAILSTQIDGKTFGVFIGGMILPGIDLMQQSLGVATAQLPKIPTEISTNPKTTDSPQFTVNPFATNTTHAIYSGAVNATLGAIQQMSQAVEQQYRQTPELIISGGNARVIAQHLTNENSPDITTHQTKKPVTITENLVLQGLYLFTKLAVKQTS